MSLVALIIFLIYKAKGMFGKKRIMKRSINAYDRLITVNSFELRGIVYDRIKNSEVRGVAAQSKQMMRMDKMISEEALMGDTIYSLYADPGIVKDEEVKQIAENKTDNAAVQIRKKL
jgi:hypothetical protein